MSFTANGGALLLDLALLLLPLLHATALPSSARLAPVTKPPGRKQHSGTAHLTGDAPAPRRQLYRAKNQHQQQQQQQEQQQEAALLDLFESTGGQQWSVFQLSSSVLSPLVRWDVSTPYCRYLYFKDGCMCISLPSREPAGFLLIATFSMLSCTSSLCQVLLVHLGAKVSYVHICDVCSPALKIPPVEQG